MPVIPAYKSRTVGSCTLIQGDCLSYIPTMPWHSIDLLLSDPPYGIRHQTNFRVVSATPDIIAGDECLTVFSQMLEVISGKLSGDAAVYCFCSPKNIESVMPFIRKLWNVKNILIWDKGNWGAGDLINGYGFQYEMIVYATKSNRELANRTGDILRFPRVSVPGQIHQHQKPDDLLTYLIENSTDEDDLVVDPFMGSGRVGVCCARLGRRFIGCEIDPKSYQQSVASVVREYAKLGHSLDTFNEFNEGAEL